MTRWILRGAAMLLALGGGILLAWNATYAEPPIGSARLGSEPGREFQNKAPLLQSSQPGYTLHYSFSPVPTDNTYVATFSPDVPQIFAWATIVQDNGADEREFEVEIQFLAPDGTPIESEWFEFDDSTVLTYPADSETFGDDNVARRVIQVAGTPNADLIGQWTVNFTVGGKLVSSGNFSLADATDIGQSETAGSAEEALTDRGYEVIEFTELEGNNNNLFAFVIMLPASQDLYSSETTQQIVDGLAALNESFPDSEVLYVFLRYDDRYEVAYFADAPDVEQYLQDNDFRDFSSKISVDVYDNELGEYLGNSSKDFINKNFGAGNYSDPPSPPLAKGSSSIGSIRVTVSPTELPADGTSKAIVSVEVFNKRNQPIPDAELEFELSGSGEGTIRPRVTSTDENGQADTVFTAGRKNGSVTITVTSGGVSGTGVISLGTGSTDQAADNVIGFLSAQGYTATRAGYLGSSTSTVGVIIDLGASYNLNQVTGPIVYGMTALRLNYPDAITLVVVIPYQNNLLMFPASAADYDKFFEAAGAATTEEEKRTAYSNFLAIVTGQAQYVDGQGNKISNFKDFYDKNFSGG